MELAPGRCPLITAGGHRPILNFMIFNMSMQEAVKRSRVHNQMAGRCHIFEPGRIPNQLMTELKNKGYVHSNEDKPSYDW